MFENLYKKEFLVALFSLSFLVFANAQHSQELTIALNHFQENLEKYNLKAEDISDYNVSNHYTSKHNQVTHIYLNQQFQGIEIYNALTNFNILPNGQVLSMSNRFVGDLANKVNTNTPSFTAEFALLAVLEHLDIETTAPVYENERVSDQHIIFEHAGIALEPITVKLVYTKVSEEEVRLSWNVNLYALDAQNWWNIRVDALNGDILDTNDWVVHCEFDIPTTTCTKHNHNHIHNHLEDIEKINDWGTTAAPPFTNNAYRVFPSPLESPNHGNRELVIGPSSANSSPFGWHDTDGEDGHEFSITRGNNVHAYPDVFNLNSSVGLEPDGGDSLLFDNPLNLASALVYNNLDAATTNLFFWNNIMHDVWYEYGFDEVSGNFQQNNYGNGGVQGDYVRAEALDGSGTNNANFATPGDGNRPRMQMFRWGGSGPASPELDPPTLNVLTPDSLSGSYDFAIGGFGGNIPTEENMISGKVVLIDDGVGVGSDACEDVINGDDIEGNIAMIDRGACEFGLKSLKAETLGAIAVIICNNIPDPIFNMGGGAVGDQVTIPAIMVSLQDCNTIKMGLDSLEIELFSPAPTLPSPGPTGRDSDFDNGVIAHEYGHGISIRLTGGANATGCLTNFEQAGEGWSDWFGLALTTTSEDSGEEGRGIGTYVSGQPTNGGGIRPYRYSRNMGINPHTYSDINSESVPHGVGSVWCVMIWDLYWNLVDLYGFDDDLYNGTGGNNIAMQLVIDGLKMQACSPTFLDSRQGILDADMALFDGAHQCLIWETFARRGLGVSAEPGGVEAFDTPTTCLEEVRITKTAVMTANAGDIISYDVEITNGTLEDLSEVTFTDVIPEHTTLIGGNSTCGGSVIDGVLTIDLGTIESAAQFTCSYQLQTDPAFSSYLEFEDDFEIGSGNWIKDNDGSGQNWTFSALDPFGGAFNFLAPNIESSSDQYLILEEAVTLTGQSPTLAFWHKFNTEENIDGGVVEVSVDGGPWQDIGSSAQTNGYNGQIEASSGTPLASKPAFTGLQEEYTQSVFDLSEFSGESIQIRFRFVTNNSVGADGWYVDNIEIFGNYHSITNVACLTDSEGEEICDKVTTTIFGDPISAVLEQTSINDIVIYPNPTSDNITIKASEVIEDLEQINIRSIDGKLLIQRSVSSLFEEEFDLSGLNSGIYLIQIQSKTSVLTRRIVVE